MAGEKSIHSGHRQRMRERFSARGFLGYQPHEVLEQFLFDVIPRGDTNETAHLLLQKFGSLDGVFTAPREELLTVKGIGEKSADYILSLYPETGAEMLEQYKSADNMSIYDLVILYDWFIKVCRDERIYVTLLDKNQKLLEFSPMETEGTVNEAISAAEKYPTAKVMYLTGRSGAVTNDMIDKIKAKFANFTAVDGLCLTDDVGFVSVSNPESVLRLYKKPTKKSLSLKKLIKL